MSSGQIPAGLSRFLAEIHKTLNNALLNTLICKVFSTAPSPIVFTEQILASNESAFFWAFLDRSCALDIRFDPMHGYFPQTLEGTNDEGSKRLNKIAGLVRSGGTLVETGCAIFSTNDSIKAWQAYATDRGITIMGSVANTSVSSNQYTGVWITLVPGGQAPRVPGP